MLLRSILTIAGLGLLSACTIPLWGEDDPALANKTETPVAVPLEVPPDLTRPVSNTQYAVPKAAASKAPEARASGTAVATPAPTTAGNRDIEERLKDVQNLRDQGLITEQELQEKRKALLDRL